MEPPKQATKKKQLSYCMAIVKPDVEEGERYLRELDEDPGDTVSKLSDQMFLNTFLRDKYVHLPMNLILFMSWLHHDDQVGRYGTELVEEALKWKSEKLSSSHVTESDVHPLHQEEFAIYFLKQFGAVHCSAAFSMEKPRNRIQHINICMTAKPGKPATKWICNLDNPVPRKGIIVQGQKWLKKEDLISGFSWNLYKLIRQYKIDMLTEIRAKVRASMGDVNDPISPGIAKANQLINIAYEKMMEKAKNKSKDKEAELVSDEDDEYFDAKSSQVIEPSMRGKPSSSKGEGSDGRIESDKGKSSRKRSKGQGSPREADSGKKCPPWRKYGKWNK